MIIKAMIALLAQRRGSVGMSYKLPVQGQGASSMLMGTSKVHEPDMTSNEGEVVMGGAGRDDVGGWRGKRELTKENVIVGADFGGRALLAEIE
jgi:hypothetical protein